MRLRSSLAAVAAVAVAFGGVLLAAAPASAAVLPVVDTLSDDTLDGNTLRDAITEANALPGADVIGFAPGLTGTIELAAPLLITEGLTITGPGADVLTIGRAPATPATDYFQFSPLDPDQDLTFSGFTIDGDGLAAGFGLHAVDAFGFVGRNLTLSGITMTDLVGAAISGGVQIEGLTGVLLIEDSTFRSITSPPGPNGAALNVRDVSTVTIEDTVYDQNSAGGGGGALSVTAVGTFTFIRGSLTANSTGGAGGAGIVDGVDLFELRDTVVSGSRVTGGGVGGGFYFGGVREVRISGTTLDDNDATVSGGSLYFAQNPAVVTISDSTFSNSDAVDEGGAIRIENIAGDARIENSTFTGNSASYGAGLFVESIFAAGSLTVSDSTFSANDGSALGTSIISRLNEGSIDIVNSTFDDGAATGAFSIVVFDTAPGSTTTLRHSTVVGPGGLGFGLAEGPIDISNSIVQSTTASPSIFVSNGVPAAVSWSLLSDAPGSTNVTPGAGVQTSANPQLGALQDNGGPTFTRLPAATSSVVNAGNPAVTGQPAFDQRGAGFPRVIGIIDLGAVERPAELPPTGSAPSWQAGMLALLVLLAGTALLLAARHGRPRAHSF